MERLCVKFRMCKFGFNVDIWLAVRIRKFSLNSSATKITTMLVFVCFKSNNGDCSGLWNRYSVDGGGNRVMSRMLLWCLYCWLWACFTDSFCVSFADFEQVIADYLDMLLLHLNIITGVNILFTLMKMWLRKPDSWYQ